MERLAEKYCLHFHKGQKRKNGNIPYSEHPLGVRDILVLYGYDDEETRAIALLHDTVEDTKLGKKKKEIEKKFGPVVYDGVYRLSKNTPGKYMNKFSDLFTHLGVKLTDEKGNLTQQAYKLRILFSRDNVKRIKIADMIHNTRSLYALSKEGVKRKIEDAENFYIPLGKCVAPEMVKELIENIQNYKKTNDYKKRINDNV
jgi:(p)ppGpp synthase/HD superfamily hydrolase